MRALCWLSVGMSFVCHATFAAAEGSPELCADAYEQAQSARHAGRLLAAREQARLCENRCPRPLARDCRLWDGQLSADIPAFVVRTHTADGTPTAAEVELDGARVDTTASGSIEADPGLHRLVVIHAGSRTETRFELLQGTRDRLVDLTLPAPPPPPAPYPLATRPPAAAPATAPGRGGGSSAWRWILGSLGAATFAAGAGVSISGEVLDGQLRGSCAPNCTQSQANEVVQRWVIGAAGMGAGGAMLLFTWLWPAPEQTSGPHLALRAGWMGAEGSF